MSSPHHTPSTFAIRLPPAPKRTALQKTRPIALGYEVEEVPRAWASHISWMTWMLVRFLLTLEVQSTKQSGWSWSEDPCEGFPILPMVAKFGRLGLPGLKKGWKLGRCCFEKVKKSRTKKRLMKLGWFSWHTPPWGILKKKIVVFLVI